MNLKKEDIIKGYGFLSFARNFGNKYGKKLMNTVIKTGTNFNSKYGKKLTDTAIKTGKDFATIAGKNVQFNRIGKLCKNICYVKIAANDVIVVNSS